MKRYTHINFYKEYSFNQSVFNSLIGIGTIAPIRGILFLLSQIRTLIMSPAPF